MNGPDGRRWAMQAERFPERRSDVVALQVEGVAHRQFRRRAAGVAGLMGVAAPSCEDPCVHEHVRLRDAERDVSGVQPGGESDGR